MTKHPDLFAALAAPFADGEVKTLEVKGRRMSYVTARTVMNRLDNVLGPENWWDRYVPGEHSVMCELTIRLPDGSTLTKADAGGYAGMSDEGDDDKSGYSDAFKRAAVKFGVARYLYRDGTPAYATTEAPRTPRERPAGSNGTNGHPPPGGKPRGQWGGPQPAPATATRPDVAPGTGKALFAWCREQEQARGIKVVRWVNEWGKRHDCPGRMVDWSREQVAAAHEAVMRKLETVESQEVPG